jgi:hypothetical protein
MELLPPIINFDPSLVSESILRATREEPASDVLIYTLLIPRQVPSISSGVDGRVCVIIVSAVSRPLECTLMQTFEDISQSIGDRRRKFLLASETSPRRVRHLLLDQGHEVELRVKLVGFRPRVREKPLLVEFLRNL